MTRMTILPPNPARLRRAWVRRRKTTTTSITRFIPAATRRTAAALTNGSTVRRSVPAVWRTIISSPICRATAFSAIRKTPRTSRNSIIILVELSSQLEQALINKYNDDLSEAANAKLTKEYVEGQYNDLVETQKNSYTSDQSAFGNGDREPVSDDSFVVYSPKEGFGFVYNILLPFSETQTQLLSTYKNDKGLKKEEVAAKRADLLEQVKGKDLRAAWFSKNEDNNYAYEAADGEEYYSGSEGSKERSNYLFFEDNLKNSEGENARYEPLKQYYGKYAYNGTVTKDEDGKYTCKPNEIGIDEFIDEMEGYLTYAGLTASGNLSSSYVTDGAYTIDEKGNFGDYSEFLYYEGSVDLGDEDQNDYFIEGTNSYTAVSVINELTFALQHGYGSFQYLHGIYRFPL